MRHYQTSFFTNPETGAIELHAKGGEHYLSLAIKDRSAPECEVPPIYIYLPVHNLEKLTRAVASFNAIMSDPSAADDDAPVAAVLALDEVEI